MGEPWIVACGRVFSWNRPVPWRWAARNPVRGGETFVKDDKKPLVLARLAFTLDPEGHVTFRISRAKAMTQALSILCIDANENHARRLALCLAAVERYDIAFHHQPDPAVALRRLKRLQADVIFIANAMPAVTGREVVSAARALGETRPIIAMACEDCGYLTADLMRAGADAFLLKRDLSPSFVQNVIARALAESRQRAAQVILKRDAIQGMLNRPRTAVLR